jgi:hypothetical protein
MWCRRSARSAPARFEEAPAGNAAAEMQESGIEPSRLPPPTPAADVDELLSVLDEVTGVLERESIDYLVMGGIASAVFGRPRPTRDIDLFVRPEDAHRVLDLLGPRGYETSEVAPLWLSKASARGVTVDVIFRSTGDILMDDEMLQRAVQGTWHDRPLPLVPPEDLFVMKVLAASEDTPRYWYDGLAILARGELDWSYLLRRARAHGPRKVLSAIIFAEASDLAVPNAAIEQLFGLVHAPATGTR